MSSTGENYYTEPDPEFDGQWMVVRNSDNLDQSGAVVGWTTGPQAEACAELVAAHINSTGHQPPSAHADELNYTAKAGEEF